ncbi:hypothetical protein LTR85_010918 [Meristemomyces frigidus]|nr:hypothetical protein LTR85_010918 [Meristemomyces frigidus]
MATSTSHAPFPSRPYTGLGRSTPYNAQQTPFNAPQQQNPAGFGTGGAAGGLGGGLGGGASGAVTQQQREAQRLERERAERTERERREAEERGALEALSEEQREEVNEAFSLFDLDKDAHIDYHELKVALKALGFDLPKAEILNILQTHGVPASTIHNNNPSNSKAPAQPTFTGPSRLLLSHATFQHIAAQRILSRDPREEILRAFELFDTEGKGRIDLADLRRVARELGEGLQEEELQAMIEEFDVRGENGIDRDTFLGICMG